MKYLILTFKSRNQLFSFARILKSNSIIIQILNTPKSIGSSCTLCIKAEYKFLNTINQLILRHQPNSFTALYSVLSSQEGQQIMRLM